MTPPTHDSRLATGDSALATAPIASSRRIHLPALDGMRGIGILAVMVTHFTHHDPDLGGLHGGAEFLDVAAWGMPMFFLLSGFLITRILLDARGKPGYFRNFYLRRVLRIFPLYYGVLGILFVLRPSIGRAIGGISSPRWLWLYATNIEMARLDRWTFGYLSHFWSLAVEEQYYLVWPFVVLAFRPKWLVAVCAGMGLFSVVLRIVMTAGWKHLIGAYVLTPSQLDPLAMGGALAVFVRWRPVSSWRTPARWAVAGSLAAFFLLGFHRMRMMDRPLIVGRPLLACPLFGGILLLAIGEAGFFRSVLGWRPFTFLGRYSYGLYVFHFILLPFLFLRFPRAAVARALGSRLAGLGVFVVVSILVTLVLAIASYELVEKRFLRLKARIAS